MSPILSCKQFVALKDGDMMRILDSSMMEMAPAFESPEQASKGSITQLQLPALT
jgi:hypothetical protein